QIRDRAGLAHTDGETQLAAADTRQDVLLDVLGSIFEQDRAALTVGDKVQVRRRTGGAKLFRYDVALQLAALVSAVLFRPRHADPAFGADPPAEAAIMRIAVPWLMRIEGAGGDFLGQERADLRAQRVAFGRQADRIELQIGTHREATRGQNSSAPRPATCLPSSAAQ